MLDNGPYIGKRFHPEIQAPSGEVQISTFIHSLIQQIFVSTLMGPELGDIQIQ
jgi:hypothetical protein